MYLAVFEQWAASSPAEENNLKTMIDKVCEFSFSTGLKVTVARANGLVYNLNLKFLGKALSLLSEQWKIKSFDRLDDS